MVTGLVLCDIYTATSGRLAVDVLKDADTKTITGLCGLFRGCGILKTDIPVGQFNNYCVHAQLFATFCRF